MMESQFDLTVGLIIKTSEPLEFITEIMGVFPTKSLRKGEGYFSFSEEVDNNIWIMRECYKERADIGSCLQDYFEHIPDYFHRINQVKRYGVCTFRISIVSIYGQIGFSLSKKDLLLLNQLNIPCEVSIFSYGNCIDE